MWRLFDLLFPPRADDLAIRDVTDDAFLAHLAPVPVPKTSPATIALFPFASASVRSAIHEAKYHGSERAFKLFATALADYLRDADDIGANSVIVPIPLGNARRRERGFNQVEEVAKRGASSCGISLEASILLRTRETLSQTALSREARKENMRGAFSAAHVLDPRTTYLLLDDVITTGATLQAAIDALKDAGAMHILPIALAH